MKKDKKEYFNLQTNKVVIPKEKQNLITDIYDNTFGNLHDPRLFSLINGTIPNIIEIDSLKCLEAIAWFTKMYNSDIKDIIYNKVCHSREKLPDYDDIQFFTFEDALIRFDIRCATVRLLYRRTAHDKINKVIDELQQFKELDNNSKIYLLIKDSNGLSLQGIKINIQEFDIEGSYNDEFLPIHKEIVKKLGTIDSKGIILLHGLPGTGKTTYIRHLISNSTKTVIFIPHTMAHALTSPDLISLLIRNKNSILVIEDAENIIVDRNRDGNSPVSAILNLSDGLLSDCLNLQIICTFNSDFTKIDNALTRKGRLIGRYEFDKLVPEKANRIAKNLGLNIKYHEPVALTDIYNAEEMSFNEPGNKHQIGFGPQRKVG